MYHRHVHTADTTDVHEGYVVASPVCQYEVGFVRESILCGNPAQILIERRDHGRIYLCEPHLTDELLAQAFNQHWIVSKLAETAENGQKSPETPKYAQKARFHSAECGLPLEHTGRCRRTE